MELICAEGAGGAGNIIVYVVLIVALLFILIAPYFTQRKRNKQYADMLSAIRVGDLVKTVGGVIGKVTKITDKGEIKTVILETGSKTEKSYMEFDITHIACVLKSSKAPEESAGADAATPAAEPVKEEAPAQPANADEGKTKADEGKTKAEESKAESPAGEAKPKRGRPKKSTSGK